MEEARAAAYYDELTRKGEGAARFKQGLGFSSSNSGEAPARASALVSSSSSSFFSTFVKASSTPSNSNPSELERESQLASVQNKLRSTTTKKKEIRTSPSRPARVSRSRSGERERERDRDRDHRSKRRDDDRDRRRRRSRSRSDSDGDRRRRRERSRRRSRSSSPRDRRSERRDRISSPAREIKSVGVDFSRLIQGYDRMSPAERVKAKMKLQLSETVEKDATKGNTGWERFEFDKDAPLDDEEIEAAEDDKAVVKNIGQTFRFASIEAKREQKIRDNHDEAMFGVPLISQPVATEDEVKSETDADKVESNGSDIASNLLSEKVLAKQQGSWRDRARRQTNSQG